MKVSEIQKQLNAGNSITFTLYYAKYEMYVGSTKIEINEGKYPDNWTWEFYLHKNEIQISVMKTVSFNLTLSNEDSFSFTFEGRIGDWTTEDGEEVCLDCSFTNGIWNIEEAE